MDTLSLKKNSPPEYYVKTPDEFLSGLQIGGMDIEEVYKKSQCVKLSIVIIVIIMVAILLCILLTTDYLSPTPCQVASQTEFVTNNNL
jgi:hypothetical protein